MAAWTLVPSLVSLRDEINRIAPKRDKASDGSIGDTAHANGGNSDHLPDEQYAALRGKDADARNEVHAIDVDKDLRQPGITMEIIVQRILTRCRSGKEKRLRYIIFNKRMWRASNNWKQETYTGSNPHDQHAHFSASYVTSHENNTSSWHLAEEKNVATQFNADDKAELRSAVQDKCTQVTQTDSLGGKVSAVGRGVLDSGVVAKTGEQRTPFYDAFRRLFEMVDNLTTVVNTLSADNAYLKGRLDALTSDPAEPGNVIVEAVRYANDNPTA